MPVLHFFSGAKKYARPSLESKRGSMAVAICAELTCRRSPQTRCAYSRPVFSPLPEDNAAR
jgi:hypothetical protein